MDLLPSGGVPAAVSALTPQRALALDALRVLRHLRDHPRDAGSWGEPAFAREVDAIRRQLGPIRSQVSLSSSFEREAGALTAGPARSRAGAGRFDAVRAAYAVRWAELGDGRPRPPWWAFVTEPG